MMHHHCSEGMELDRAVLVEDHGDTICFTALSPDGRVWMQDNLGDENEVVIRDRAVAGRAVHNLCKKSHLRFRISVDAEVLDKVELLKAAFYGPATLQ